MSDIYNEEMNNEIVPVQDNEESGTEEKKSKIDGKKVRAAAGLLLVVGLGIKAGKKVVTEVKDYKEYKRWKKSYKELRTQPVDPEYDEEWYDDDEVYDGDVEEAEENK